MAVTAYFVVIAVVSLVAILLLPETNDVRDEEKVS